jgi:hypothetical protein
MISFNCWGQTVMRIEDVLRRIFMGKCLKRNLIEARGFIEMSRILIGF